MSILVWDTNECPSCGATVPVGLMSLSAACACGMVYIEERAHRGWYFSWGYFESGGVPVGAGNAE